jgi:hypothetical protein
MRTAAWLGGLAPGLLAIALSMLAFEKLRRSRPFD